MKRDHLLDSEDRNSHALGAIEGLGDLINQLAPGASIDPASFAYLYSAVADKVRAAIEMPCDFSGRISNDD